MPRHVLLRFWGWVAAAGLLGGLVPVAAVLGLSVATSPAVHVAVACALPVLVGLAVRAAAAARISAVAGRAAGPRSRRTPAARRAAGR